MSFQDRRSRSGIKRRLARQQWTRLLPLLLIVVGWFWGNLPSAEGGRLFQDSPPLLSISPYRDYTGGSTDCDSLVGQGATTQLFIRCHAGGNKQYTLTWDNPNFEILYYPARGELDCLGGLFNPHFRFVATRPGLDVANITLTVQGVGTVTTQLIGNGVIAETPPQWLVELPKGTYGWANILDQARELLYISDVQQDRVLVFSLPDRAVIGAIPVGAKPYGLALSPDQTELYVANSDSQSISVINTASRQEVRRLRLPNQLPEPGYKPYSLAIVDQQIGFLGTTPPGRASGGPIYQFHTTTGAVWRRNDINTGRNPQIRQSRDYEWTAILVEPYSSPTELALYDYATDSFTRTFFGIEKQLALSRNGRYIVTTDEGYSGHVPDLTLYTEELQRVGRINLLGTGSNSVAFSPMTARWVYAQSAIPDVHNLAEASTLEMRQTRSLRYVAPPGFYISFGSLVISDDGNWAYMILNDTVYFQPTSKILALQIRRPDASPDREPPVATVLLPAYHNTTSWTVKWAGHDSASDIARFDVQYRAAPSQIWNDWVSTSRGQATFAGAIVGETYCFRVRATDAASNTGAYSADQSACTTVDQQPPVAQVTRLAPEQERAWWVVDWTGRDDISGILRYELQVRTGADGDWVDWISSSGTRAIFRAAVPGESYCFRIQAMDRAGNVGSYPAEPDTCTIAGFGTDGLHAAYLPLINRLGTKPYNAQ